MPSDNHFSLGMRRRNYKRLSNLQKIKFDLSAGQGGGLLINQSQGGMFIQTNRLLKRGSLIRLRDDHNHVFVQGKVAWNRPPIEALGQFGGMGVQIFFSNEEYFNLLKNLSLKNKESIEELDVKEGRLLSNLSLDVELPMEGELCDFSTTLVLEKASLLKERLKLTLYRNDHKHEFLIDHEKISLGFFPAQEFQYYLFVKGVLNEQEVFEAQQYGDLQSMFFYLMSKNALNVHLINEMLNEFVFEKVLDTFLWRKGSFTLSKVLDVQPKEQFSVELKVALVKGMYKLFLPREIAELKTQFLKKKAVFCATAPLEGAPAYVQKMVRWFANGDAEKNFLSITSEREQDQFLSSLGFLYLKGALKLFQS